MSQPVFIAEASSNHARDLARALAFVDAAADAGSDADWALGFGIDTREDSGLVGTSRKVNRGS